MADFRGGNFWTGVIAGWILMIIVDLFVPVAGPFVGGFAAGYIARGGPWNAGIAGLVSGILGGIIVVLLVLVGSTVLLGGVGFFTALFVGILLMVVLFLVHGILAFIGGAIAGALRG
ncbi:MAG: DUF5518 domain-containing protein [Methanomicrobiales archaeon]|nr:DUF5518 domain-containing protein [Methanomicrobiales archaeon]MDI6875983.1 DUF5518 domain-containing protein [Methanomicrobiales archaeon]